MQGAINQTRLERGDEIEIFVIFDTLTGELWRTGTGKNVWRKPAHAKNATYTRPPEGMQVFDDYGRPCHYRHVNFNDQSRYVVKRVTLSVESITDA